MNTEQTYCYESSVSVEYQSDHEDGDDLTDYYEYLEAEYRNECETADQKVGLKRCIDIKPIKDVLIKMQQQIKSIEAAEMKAIHDAQLMHFLNAFKTD